MSAMADALTSTAVVVSVSVSCFGITGAFDDSAASVSASWVGGVASAAVVVSVALRLEVEAGRLVPRLRAPRPLALGGIALYWVMCEVDVVNESRFGKILALIDIGNFSAGASNAMSHEGQANRYSWARVNKHLPRQP